MEVSHKRVVAGLQPSLAHLDPLQTTELPTLRNVGSSSLDGVFRSYSIYDLSVSLPLSRCVGGVVILQVTKRLFSLQRSNFMFLVRKMV